MESGLYSYQNDSAKKKNRSLGIFFFGLTFILSCGSSTQESFFAQASVEVGQLSSNCEGEIKAVNPSSSILTIIETQILRASSTQQEDVKTYIGGDVLSVWGSQTIPAFGELTGQLRFDDQVLGEGSVTVLALESEGTTIVLTGRFDCF